MRSDKNENDFQIDGGIIMKIQKRKPVTMITGYLGSGKTTVLNELLKSQTGERLAIIVNDLGSINIDASVIKKNSVVEAEAKMIEMTNGCICCTLQEAFMEQIERLSADDKVDKIIVEASGVSNPAAIAYGFLNYQKQRGDSGVYLDSIVTVADADRLYNEFIEDIKGKDGERSEDPDILNLVMDQIEFCNTVLLSKCDLLSRSQVDELKDVIRTFQNEAEIYETVYGEIDPDKIFSGKKFDYDRVRNSSALQRAMDREEQMEELFEDDYGITSFSFRDPRPFDYDKFIDLISYRFPEELIRGKGYMWFKNDDVHVHLFEQVGRNSSVTEVSNWVASMPKEEQDEVFKEFPEIKEEWHEKYGDRLNQLVFIGKGYNKDEFVKDLKACLVD